MRQCLKCGKKTEGNAAFCEDCLAVMEQYPVKPGTIVHIPRRPTRTEVKKLDTFDQNAQAALLAQQRNLIRWLTAVIAGLSIFLVIAAVLLLHTLDKKSALPAIGRNYTTSTSTSTNTSTSGQTP